jgi:excisionase family DNA binding protein
MNGELRTRKYYTPEEVAEELRVTRRTIYSWLKSGRLPGVRVGRGWRIRAQDLEAVPESTALAVASGSRSAAQSPPEAEAVPVEVRLARMRAMLDSFPPVGKRTPEEHAAVVEAIAGSFAWVPGSVDDFLREKHEETGRDDPGEDGEIG